MRDNSSSMVTLNKQFILYFILLAYIPLVTFSILGFFLNKRFIRHLYLDAMQDQQEVVVQRMYKVLSDAEDLSPIEHVSTDNKINKILQSNSEDRLARKLNILNSEIQYFLFNTQTQNYIELQANVTLNKSPKELLKKQNQPFIFDVFNDPMQLFVVKELSDNWQIISRRTTQGIYTDLRGFLLEIIIANIFIGILMLIIAIMLSRRITNPIQSLIREVKIIGKGDLSHPINIASHNEVKTLADEFELMRKKLLDSYSNLESKIEERTRALRDAQFQISHQEKMASLGIMAAGVAHEIGNPLTSISSMAQILKRKTDDPSFTEYLDTIMDNINRISHIVRELVDFARPASYEADEVEVNSIIENAVNIVKYDRRAKYSEIELKLDSDLPKLNLVADQLLQVFINILINAVDALKSSQNKIFVRTYADKEFVFMEFKDTGVGIENENLSKIFEPFFTTKSVGKGTGLGLSVSYGIVKNFGGTIEVKSELGRGSTFTVKIPVNSEESTK
ncbi:MAG: HAMP domain-containing protein [Caldithrix sp.]|nr:HAMP domain-containing protein [Caldithrix sp.]